MHASVEKYVIRFGGPATRSAQGSSALVDFAAIPGVPPYVGSGQGSNSDPALSASAVIIGDPNHAGTSYNALTTLEQSIRRVDISRIGGEVSAIAIAPDSAIAECDVWLGNVDERSHFRISPGNPLLGCQLADYLQISIPNSIPAISSAVPSQLAVLWDAQPFVSGANTYWGFPLRLEIWRGSVLPIRAKQRANYRAHALLQVGTTARDFYVCVDGRRRIDLAVYADAADYTLTVFGGEGIKSSNAGNLDSLAEAQLALDTSGSLSKVLSNGVISYFSFYGNPFTMLRIHLIKGASNGNPQVKVLAMDE